MKQLEKDKIIKDLSNDVIELSKQEQDKDGLEKIIALQVQYETTLKQDLEAEKRVSGALMKKWLGREQTITDWEYSYWTLQQKFTKALKDIRFLSHYIETEVKKKKDKAKKNEKRKK